MNHRKADGLHPGGLPDNIDLMQNNLVPNDTQTVKDNIWHSDLASLEKPIAITVLYMNETTTGWEDIMLASVNTSHRRFYASIRRRASTQ